MATKAKFQGYAIGKGFSNIDPGYSALTRLQEKQNQDLANLKLAEKDRRDRDLQAEADLERVMKNEEANRKEIYIEDKVFSTRQQALQINRDQAVQNQKAEIKKIEEKNNNFQQIIAFSKTAFEDYKKIKEKDWDATADASYNYYMTHGTSLQDQIRQDLIEDKLFEQGADFEALADQMREEGYSNEEVHYVRRKNSASDYGRLKAYSVKAGEGWQAFARSELIRMGITDRVEQEAALDALRIKYLKSHKLYGISSDFLEPMFQKMRAGTQKLLSATQFRNDVEFTQKETARWLEQLSTHQSPDSLNSLFLARTREINPETGLTYTKAEAKQYIFDTLENIYMFPEQEKVFELLNNTKMLHMNKFWGDEVNQEFINSLWDARLANEKDKNTKTEELVKHEKEKLLKTTLEFFDDPNRWNGDKRVGDEILKELRSKGFNETELSIFFPYLDQSVQGRSDGDEWRKIINDAAKNNTLTTEDLNNPYVPRDLKARYREEAQQNDAYFTEDKMKLVKDSLSMSLKAKLGELSLDKTVHPSYNLALFQAIAIYKSQFKENGADHDKALQYVKQMINNEKEGSLFEVIDSTKLKGNQSIFSHFTTGDHDNSQDIYKPVRTEDQRKNIVLEIGGDPTKIDTVLYITDDELKNIAENIKLGKSYRIPQVYFDIYDIDKEGFGSPINIWQRQLKLAVESGQLDKIYLGKEQLDIEDFRITLFRDVDDPKAKDLISKIRTKGDFLKAMQISRNPQSTRDPRFYATDVIRKRDVRSVLETELTREDMRDDSFFEYDIETGTYQIYEVD